MDNLLQQVDLGLERDAELRSSYTSNAEAMKGISRLYFRPGMAVADVTYGKGVFWRQVDVTQFDFRPTDILQGTDFTDLPYATDSLDAVVFDPPYRYTPAANRANPHTDERYQLSASAPTNHAGVLALYEAGMREARRVLKTGGFLIVKCQDSIEAGRQEWAHIDIYNSARSMGLGVTDLAVVAFQHAPPTRWKIQKSLRKNHSYFWIFRKGGTHPFGMPSVQKR